MTLCTYCSRRATTREGDPTPLCHWHFFLLIVSCAVVVLGMVFGAVALVALISLLLGKPLDWP